MRKSFQNSMTSPRFLGVVAGFSAGLLGVSMILSGCGPESAQENNTDGKPADNGKSKFDERCRDMISSSFEMLRPDRLGISSDQNQAIGVLNDWLRTCGAGQGDAVWDPVEDALLETVVEPDDRKLATQPRFSNRTAEHIRNCLLAKETTEFALTSATDDLNRVVRLFDYVCRNVALVNEDAIGTPRTRYHIILFGQGTAEDRAWFFAELLRQLQIDAVILRPRASAEAAEAKAAEGRWLVGVLLDGEVYLFDPHLGWPIPSADDAGATVTVERPATLSSVLTRPELLRALDIDAEHPYPLTGDGLAHLRVELIGNLDFWNPRMRQLQMALAGDQSLVVFDGLADRENERGLVTRVASAGKGRWTKDDISVWPYPERNRRNLLEMDEKQQQRFLFRMEPFGAPVPMQATRDGEGRMQVKVIGLPERQQLKIRIDQLLGEHQSAITRYTDIQRHGIISTRVSVPPAVVRMHLRAAVDAFFWIGLCQFEDGAYRPAADTFRDYQIRHKAGKWIEHARGLQGLSLARAGRWTAAVKALERVRPGQTQRDDYTLLIRRWRKLAARESTGNEAGD